MKIYRLFDHICKLIIHKLLKTFFVSIGNDPKGFFLKVNVYLLFVNVNPSLSKNLFK
jgi:hypothetical protein